MYGVLQRRGDQNVSRKGLISKQRKFGPGTSSHFVGGIERTTAASTSLALSVRCFSPFPVRAPPHHPAIVVAIGHRHTSNKSSALSSRGAAHSPCAPARSPYDPGRSPTSVPSSPGTLRPALPVAASLQRRFQKRRRESLGHCTDQW